MKRRLLVVVMFLLAGAVVNVAVAWGCLKFWSRLVPTDSSPSAEDEAWLVGIAPLPRGQHWEVLDLTTVASFGHELRIMTAHVRVEDGPNVTRGATGIRRVVGWPSASVQFSNFRVHPFKGGSGLPPVGRFHFTWLGAPGVLPPFDILWSGFAVNTVFYATLLWLLIPGPFVLRRVIRVKRGRCPACAYPMGASDVCSECGKAG